MIQLVQGMQDVKLNNCERQKRWEWERIQVRLFRIGLKGLKIAQIQQYWLCFLYTNYSYIHLLYSGQIGYRWFDDPWHVNVSDLYCWSTFCTR